MKTAPLLLLACALASVALAADEPPAPSDVVMPNVIPVDAAVNHTLALHEKVSRLIGTRATAAAISAPFVLKDRVVSQPVTTGLAEGGRAVFKFTVAAAGTYVLSAVVDAPGGRAGSFYVNFDQPPVEPQMIWDVRPTKGLEVRLVGWRGRGEADRPEFAPRKFQLAKGEHELIVVGREAGAAIKSIAIHPTRD